MLSNPTGGQDKQSLAARLVIISYGKRLPIYKEKFKVSMDVASSEETYHKEASMLTPGNRMQINHLYFHISELPLVSGCCWVV